MVVTAIRSDVVLVRVIIGCMFFRVVIESKTYCIYEPVLQAIKAVTHNLTWASNFIS
jgi:hypothetical protein